MPHHIKTKRKSLLPWFKYAALAVCCAGELFSQSFYGAGVSASTTARGGIYVATPDGALDSLSLNPAGLAALASPVVNLSTSVFMARGSFSNSANDATPMRPTAGAVPFGAFGMPLGHSRWSVGAGVAPDLLSSVNWRYADANGAAGGANYGVQNEKSAIIAIRSSAGAAFAVTKNVSLGATFGAVYNSNTLEGPYIFQINPDLKGLKTLLDLHSNGVGWDGSFGLRARVLSKLELNAAYRTSTTITSHGNATGNMGVQFNALGIPFQPDFAYRAQVKVVLPQSVLLGASWKVTPGTRLSFQTDWINWHRAFNNLPVDLSNGTNADINHFLNSTSILDAVPLDWKDQFSFRGGLEHAFGERLTVSGGFAHGNDPVPGSTLSPLTAVIMQNGLSTGMGFLYGRFRFDLAYGIKLRAASTSGISALQAGEFNNSRVAIGTQVLTLTTTFHL